jgi:hypothetical protein
MQYHDFEFADDWEAELRDRRRHPWRYAFRELVSPSNDDFEFADEYEAYLEERRRHRWKYAFKDFLVLWIGLPLIIIAELIPERWFLFLFTN